jgi:hypothetical protein
LLAGKKKKLHLGECFARTSEIPDCNVALAECEEKLVLVEEDEG